MATTRKSLTTFQVDYDFDSFPLGYGEAQSKVKISGKTASWANGIITVTEKTTSIKPTIYSSFGEGNDRSQPLKQVDSSQYIPLATITVTNNQEPDGTLFLYNPGQIPLDSTINLALKGGIQNINFAPLKIQRIYIGFKDFAENRESNINKDAVVFPNVSSYQNLKIINPQTGRLENSSFYFGYVGAVQGGPKQITKDQLLVPGGKAGNTSPLDDGQTKTFTLYGRLFVVDIFDPINITSISEDIGIKGDFRTSDTTLIFNGTAEARSKVDVFINNSRIGTTNADAQGKWSYDYTGFKFPDGKYWVALTAAETNLFGEVKTTIPQKLEIDTRYNIDLDFSDPSIANNQALQKQIKDAAKYWEEIIKYDIPDVTGPDAKGVEGFIDDLKITFQVKDIDGKGKKLADTGGGDLRINLPTNSVDPLTGQSLSSFNHLPFSAVITIDNADLNDITNTNYGLYTLKHEMAHAIGFNSDTFNKKGFIKPLGIDGVTGENAYGFTGKNALNAYHSLGGKKTHTSVPLEDDEKSTPGHWNEWLFPDKEGEVYYLYSIRGKDELMTTANPPGQNAILSKLTLGAFKDLGFTVDDAKAGSINIFTGDRHPVLGPFENPLFDIAY